MAKKVGKPKYVGVNYEHDPDCCVYGDTPAQVLKLVAEELKGYGDEYELVIYKLHSVHKYKTPAAGTFVKVS